MKEKNIWSLDTKLYCFLDQLPGYWACKNEDSVYMYLNQALKRLIGVEKNNMNFVGKTDFDLPCLASNHANDFIKHDKLVYHSKKNIRILEIHPFVDNIWKAIIFTKMPLYENEKLIGTFFQASDVTSQNFLELGMLLLKHSNCTKKGLHGFYTIEKEDKKFKISKRENECLFFFLRGKSPKHIARYLNISVRTVEQHLEYLKLKFRVNNKVDLFEKAVESGFVNNIPQSLFDTQLTLILGNDDEV